MDNRSPVTQLSEIYLSARIRDLVSANVRLEKERDSMLERLREIAALAGTTKRKQAGCELAATWLYAHGYALWDGGYIPGLGFEDSAAAMKRRAGDKDAV
jgi:hypothetical protein